MAEPVVTVVIPTMPGRERWLSEALESVWAQTTPCLVSIAYDAHGEGAAVTRNRALRNVRTRYAAFLDDDDLLMPHHVATLLEKAQSSRCDVVYSGARVIGPNHLELDMGRNWDHFGSPFNPERLRNYNYIPVTALVRTKAALTAGGFRDMSTANGADPCEDWGLWLAMLDAGYVFRHVPVKTWIYRRMGQNTGGKAGLRAVN